MGGSFDDLNIFLQATATVLMENIPAGWTLTQIHLDVVAAVPGAA